MFNINFVTLGRSVSHILNLLKILFPKFFLGHTHYFSWAISSGG